MRTALCLGGGYSLQKDIDAVPVAFDGVVACNEAGAHWPGHLDGWVSLHPKKFPKWSQAREENGYAPCPRFFSHAKCNEFPSAEPTPYVLDGMSGSGSSGLFAAKVALDDLEFDRVILCGVPMTPSPHFFDEIAWRSSHHFRKHWRSIDESYRARIRSMSGWSRIFFSGPEDWT